MEAPAQTIRDTALELRASGISILPIVADGSKSPATGSWRHYQTTIADEQTITGWFPEALERGIAVIGGQVSGGLEVLDFDLPGLYDQWLELVGQAGLLALIDTLPLEATPKGGRHLFWRCSTYEGNTKLAKRAKADGSPETVIETRGEGGYAIVSPSPAACHPLGKPYVMLRGAISKTPEIDPATRETLLSLARSFNEYVAPERAYSEMPQAASAPKDSTIIRPGDDYNARADWREILEPHGWRLLYYQGQKGLWQRPGKDGTGISGTTNYAGGKYGDDRLYVFSSNAYPFESERTYSKFQAYTLLEHNGDFKAAARELGRNGYGVSLSNVMIDPNPRTTGNGHTETTIEETTVEVKAEQPKKPAIDLKKRIATILADTDRSMMVRGAQVSELIINDMKLAGDFYYQADDPDFQYFFDHTKKVVRPLGMRARDEAWLRHYIAEHYGVLASSNAYPYIHDSLTHYCAYHGKPVKMRRFAWYDRKYHELYVYNNAGRMYRLDGESIAELDNGTNGIMFEDINYAPFEADFNENTGLLHKHIYTIPNYNADGVLNTDEQRLLLVLWTIAPFFDDLFQSRPILLLYGGSGGGKSTVLRAYTRLILGPDHNLAPVPRDENNFDEAVLANRIICFDNADSYYKYLPDKLAVTATGYEVPRRQLYTTAKIVRFPVRCWIAMTSRDQYFAREDVTSRMLILHTQQMTTKIPEKEIMDAVDDNRNKMWGELLANLNQVMATLASPESYRGAFRMADFAWFGINASKVWNAERLFTRALDALSYDQNALAMEGNPLFDVLTLWIANPTNIGRGILGITLHKELADLALAQYGPRCEYFDYCKSANWLVRRLRQNMRALGQYFIITEETDSHTKKTIYHFSPKK